MSISKGNAGIGPIYVGQKEVEKVFKGASLVYQSGPVYDPVFANNDWATIRAIVRSGNVPGAWAVGDTKSILLSNGQTIVYRICDKQTGRYALADGTGSSNMVLEPVAQINGLASAMYQAPGGDFSAVNGYGDSYIRGTIIPSVYAMFPEEVKASMSEVMVLSSIGSKATTAVAAASPNKLFLPAERELYAETRYSVGLAECPLGQFDYYKAHTDNSARIKNRDGAAMSYWERSGSIRADYYFCYTYSEGTQFDNSCTPAYGIAPYFAI